MCRREAHVGQEAAPAPLGDVSLGLGVGLGGGGADHVDPQFVGDPFELSTGHERIVP